MLVTLDVSMPASPRIVATLKVQSAKYAEDLDLAERADGTAFVLYGATDTPASNEDGLTIVDVSDPSAPRRIGGLAGLGSHTWTCVSKECTYAYGTVRDGQSFAEQVSGFAIVDLRNPHRPVVVGYQESLVSGPPPGVLHDWNADPAGVMWAVGHNGIAAYDATHPRNPQALNRSDANGEYLGSANNDRLQLHGSLRPNSTSFVPNLGRNTASVHSGNVLLVSEEGDDQDCTDSFQTWYVPDLATFPEAGTITPLGSWSLAENTAPGLDRPAVHDDWCSVHWFDYHQDGFVVLAAYSAGTRIVNVNDPNAIGEVAYHFGESNAAWQSRWVPERDRFGRATGRATTLVYTADAGNSFVIETEATTGPPTTGGIDVFRATLP